MVLTIDIGNTHTVIGGFFEDALQFVARIATDAKKTETEYAFELKSILHLYDVHTKDVSGAIISSVVPPLNYAFKTALKIAFGVDALIVGPGIKTGINLTVDNPSQVGADIICGCVAGNALYSGTTLIIDMGTATKFMVIDKDAAVQGVIIAPGVEISLKALSGGTAQLPQISLDAPKNVLGKNTVDCMKSGVVFGSASMLDGMIERIKAEVGDDINIVATGGLSKVIVPHCKNEITVDGDLLLKGLYVLYTKNNR